MLSRLTKGMDKDEEEQFRYEYEKAFRFRKRLSEVLEEDLENLYSEMRNDDKHDSGWPYRQADMVAQSKVYKKYLNLLK